MIMSQKTNTNKTNTKKIEENKIKTPVVKNTEVSKTDNIKTPTVENTEKKPAVSDKTFKTEQLLDLPVFQNMLTSSDGGMGKVGEFPHGDDRALIFHVIDEIEGERLAVIWSQNGSGRGETFPVPVLEGEFYLKSSNPTQRSERVKYGIKLIKDKFSTAIGGLI